MTVKFAIMLVVLAGVAILFWFAAGKIYESHKRTRDDHPFLFKITGINEKYLDNAALWIRHFRIQLILMLLLFFTILIALM